MVCRRWLFRSPEWCACFTLIQHKTIKYGFPFSLFRMTASIVVTRQRAIGDLLLNRPQAMNSLSLGMIRTLTQALSEWKNNPGVHAVVIRSSLPKTIGTA